MGSTSGEMCGCGCAAGMLPTVLAAGAGPAVLPAITLAGVEIIQSVQEIGNSVSLISGKQTLVRIYLSVGGAAPIHVRGTLKARRSPGAGWTQIASLSDVALNPAQSGPTNLQLKRNSLALSLNFVVPSALTAAGSLELELHKLQTVSPVKPLNVPPGSNRTVRFRPNVPLRLHVVGIRYSQTIGGITTDHEPSATDFALIHSWLQRAYPVANVIWSQVTIDWPASNPWPTTGAALGIWGSSQVNPWLAALRGADVSSGVDHRTHYFALAADSGGFMRGFAAGIPGTADPSVVACGPTGPSGFPWDTDGSYGDWYTGHELAHTFGRLHPGFCNGNSADDAAFPYPNGQIAHNNGDFVGYDSGDSTRSIAPAALPGLVWHDVMTYCDNQWLSAYTYEAIFRRLAEEDVLPAPGAPAGGPAPGAPKSPAANPGGQPMALLASVHLVARVNETLNTGKIQFVNPVVVSSMGGAAPANPNSRYTIRVTQNTGQVSKHKVDFRRDACGDPNDPEVKGTIDVVVPADAGTVSIELLRAEKVLDTFRPPADPAQPTDVKSARSTAAGIAPGGVALAGGPSQRPRVTWKAASQRGAVPMAAGGHATETYTVQISTDAGQSWRTIGVGLVTPEVGLDPQLLSGVDSVQVRVTATNGVRSESTTKTLPVDDL